MKYGDADYLQRLPDKLMQGDFTLVYGSPCQPVWEYLLSVEEACDNFSYFGTKFYLVQIIYHYRANYDIFAGQGETMKR